MRTGLEPGIGPHRHTEEQGELEGAPLAIPGGHRGGVDPDTYFVLLGDRGFYLPHLEDLRGSVAGPNDSFHERSCEYTSWASTKAASNRLNTNAVR